LAWQVTVGAFTYALGALVLLAAGGGAWVQHHLPRSGFYLLPMMDLDPCLLRNAGDSGINTMDNWKSACDGPAGSAAHLIESTLKNLQAVDVARPDWQLGYTLKVPLLALLKPAENTWILDHEAIGRITRTVLNSPRPLLLYLFSSHFGVNAPIEASLAGDPVNLGRTPAGPLKQDTYYGQPVYPWSIASTNNPLTSYRAEVITALLQRLCTLPADKRNRIKGISLLGETHQLFPGFEAGMGFDKPYLVSDYSETSVNGFRQYLAQHYGSVQTLNDQIGSSYPSFDSIDPPSKNIRTETLTRFEDHLDAFAAGYLPISGWVHAPDSPVTGQFVKIFLDGKPVATAPVHLSRQDVSAAHPEFKTADVGWRYDLDFSQLKAGIYRIDIALAQPGQALVLLATRSISIMDRRQNTPVAAPATALEPMLALPNRVTAFTDEPQERASYYFNPLAREWLAFREAQVVKYLQFFNHLVAQTCFLDTPRYTHQIVPQFNPSWDSSRYAAGATLQRQNNLRLGVSLYGESSYGRSFGDWLAQRPKGPYGVTEFHPLKAMGPQQLGQVLNQHRRQGAKFVSFFLETRWQTERVSSMPNLFSFDPDNPRYGSDQLYLGMRELLVNP